ncbi:hypothetical protein BC835DRAFT_1091508 [Cytidiella melzeri]|nr:hypothetical protein BC835DRAFT_1091508 [Cytidiella melzeri]
MYVLLVLFIGVRSVSERLWFALTCTFGMLGNATHMHMSKTCVLSTNFVCPDVRMVQEMQQSNNLSMHSHFLRIPSLRRNSLQKCRKHRHRGDDEVFADVERPITTHVNYINIHAFPRR